jgi:hypothetical protein
MERLTEQGYRQLLRGGVSGLELRTWLQLQPHFGASGA